MVSLFILNSRQIPESEAKKIAENYKMCRFLETSAKTGFNAQEMFIEAATILYIDYIKFNKLV